MVLVVYRFYHIQYNFYIYFIILFLQYNFDSRQKEYPHLKNATAQSWVFKSQLTVINTGATELKTWQAFIGFQHREILVQVDGATILNGDSFPMKVGKNGTYLTEYPQADLRTAIDTAGDLGSDGGEGFKCPKATTKGRQSMHVCCRKDPRFKPKKKLLKFFPRRADLS
ncbi:hypothetical protein LXL04_029605 [Taraxacum kok-saghyz]